MKVNITKKVTKGILALFIFIALVILFIRIYSGEAVDISNESPKDINTQNESVETDSSITPHVENHKDADMQSHDEIGGSVASIKVDLSDLDQLLNVDNLQTWSSLDFIKIENTEAFREYISGYRLKDTKYSLSENQKEEFINHLKQTCMAYNIGTYDEYTKFRIPTDKYTYDKGKLDWYKYALGYHYDVDDSDIPSDEEDLVKLYWEKTNKSEASFTGLWEAVYTPEVTIHHSNTLPMRLIDMANLLDKSALGGSKLINYERSPSVILREQGKLLYADIEYIVKHKTGLSYPIIIRSYWDDTSMKWLPNEILICYTGKGRLVDPEF